MRRKFYSTALDKQNYPKELQIAKKLYRTRKLYKFNEFYFEPDYCYNIEISIFKSPNGKITASYDNLDGFREILGFVRLK